METIVATLNLDKICRACLLECDEMHSIYSGIENPTDPDGPLFLYDIFGSISSIKVVTGEKLPTLVCSNCMNVALAMYKFQQQCNRSQAILVACLEAAGKNTRTINPHESIESEIVLQILQSESETAAHVPLDIPMSVQLMHADDVAAAFNFAETQPESQSNNSIDDIQVDEMPLIKSETVEEELDFDLKAATPTEVVAPPPPTPTDADNPSTETASGHPALGFSYKVQMTNGGDKLYRCNHCENAYKHKNSLRLHLRNHTLEKPYVCSYCGKAFTQNGALIYHIRGHTGEQPYCCKVCGKRYKQAGTLTAHMRVHTGQKPYLCSVCGRGFRQAPDLGYHMRTHTQERPYMCNICGKTMRMQCHLVQHIRTHTGEKPFKCSECDKAFSSTTHLKRHAIIHTGLKPYTCETCDKSFNRLSSLRVHEKIHSDERPHVCTVCNKGFIQFHALKSHLMTHSARC